MSLEMGFAEGALPTLRSLDVSWCNVAAEELQAIVATRPRLTSLNLSMCAHATAQLFAPPLHAAAPAAGAAVAPWLRELLCVGCPALRAVHLPADSPSFASLRVRTLLFSLLTRLRSLPSVGFGLSRAPPLNSSLGAFPRS
jgi:hypothetical protein